MGKCKVRKAFNKIDELKLECLKCWKDGIKKANDCKFHAVKVRQFECVTHSSTEEEKIALVDKMVKFDELCTINQFTIQHTSEVCDKLVYNLYGHTIVKVQDFSENSTCLFPDEIQSLH